MAYIGGKLKPFFGQTPVHRAMRNMVRVGVTEAANVAAGATPVDTSNLRDSWETTPAMWTMSFMGKAMQAEWKNDTEYAPYVNYGTGLYGPEHRRYLIMPKKPGGSLHWVDRLTGEDRFAKWVMHPGSEGHHMLEISASALEATWTRLVRPVLRNWVRETERQNPWVAIT